MMIVNRNMMNIKERMSVRMKMRIDVPLHILIMKFNKKNKLIKIREKFLPKFTKKNRIISIRVAQKQLRNFGLIYCNILKKKIHLEISIQRISYFCYLKTILIFFSLKFLQIQKALTKNQFPTIQINKYLLNFIRTQLFFHVLIQWKRDKKSLEIFQ